MASHEVKFSDLPLTINGKAMIVQIPRLHPLAQQPSVPFPIIRARTAQDDTEKTKASEKAKATFAVS